MYHNDGVIKKQNITSVKKNMEQLDSCIISGNAPRNG